MLHLWNSTVFFIQTGLKKNWKVLDWEFICNCRSKICINIRTGWGLRGKSLEDFSYQTFRFCSRGLSFSEETNISKCERGYALRAADKSQENVEAAAIKWKLISGRILQSTRCIDNAYLDWFSPHSLNSFFFFFWNSFSNQLHCSRLRGQHKVFSLSSPADRRRFFGGESFQLSHFTGVCVSSILVHFSTSTLTFTYAPNLMI